jgi:HD-GYP domain-containing protein (c-di-GMP phosphodiesterase class II)
VHHEKLDGSGYPYGLRSAQLDRASRILVVADMYDALTADRPNRAGLTPDDALGILRAEAGTRVCDESVDALRAGASVTGPPHIGAP